MREWKMSNKKSKFYFIRNYIFHEVKLDTYIKSMSVQCRKLRINQEIVTAKWFSDIETPRKKLSKTVRLYVNKNSL